jgi:hypothetical protein
VDFAFLTAGSALLVGLFGAPHCGAMCGGIAGSLTLGLPPERRAGLGRQLPYQLAYNSGRIASYTLAGAIAGALGTLVSVAAGPQWLPLVLRLLAGGLVVGMGLYVAGWWPGLAQLERVGLPVWRWLEPLGRRLFPVDSVPKAAGLGLVWGWLPCGMVYLVLIQALTTGSPGEGALLMAAFGAGTLPALLGIGLFAGWLGPVTSRLAWRRGAGVVLIILGLAQANLALLGTGPAANMC